MPTTLMRQVRRHGRGQVDDAHRRDLRHEDLAAVHALEVLEHEVDALLQRDPEAGHARIGDRQMSAPSAISLLKNGTTEPREPTTLP